MAAQEYYWGKPSATLNWCEEDYVVLTVIAEFFNTISNFIYLLVASIGLYNAYRHGSEKRFLFSYFALALVGIGSCLFHATLLFEFQMLDECPMIVGISCFTFCVLTVFPSTTRTRDLVSAAFCIIYAASTISIYLYWPNPVFHQAAFGFLIAVSAVVPTFNFIRFKRMEAERARPLATAFIVSVASFLVGFIFWNLDNIFCETLKKWRHAVGPFAFLLQWHAMWHFGTGYGCYASIAATEVLRSCVKEGTRGKNLSLAWKFGFPCVISSASLRAKEE